MDYCLQQAFSKVLYSMSPFATLRLCLWSMVPFLFVFFFPHHFLSFFFSFFFYSSNPIKSESCGTFIVLGGWLQTSTDVNRPASCRSHFESVDIILKQWIMSKNSACCNLLVPLFYSSDLMHIQPVFNKNNVALLVKIWCYSISDAKNHTLKRIDYWVIIWPWNIFT